MQDQVAQNQVAENLAVQDQEHRIRSADLVSLKSGSAGLDNGESGSAGLCSEGSDHAVSCNEGSYSQWPCSG
jgi:hypothetical protein